MIPDLGDKYNAIHFIGIGGVNMSGLAEYLFLEGYPVTGSDRNSNDRVKRLRELGIDAKLGHCEANLPPNADLVVYTGAVKEDNPEYREALRRGIKIMERSEFLGILMKNFKYPICVAGTHGKTTTTSMLAEIFTAAGADPTVMNGSVMKINGSTMLRGSSEYFIVESCEYRNSFLQFHPYIGIILNIEKDHTDFFKDLNDIRGSFRNFAALIPQSGVLVVNKSIKSLEELTDGLNCPVITFGEGGDWQSRDIEYTADGMASFTACLKDKVMGKICLAAPGAHNVGNALAAIAAAYQLGLSFDSITKGLSGYTGVARRFQYKGTLNGARVYDDYAHHPTEIKATLAAAANMPHKRVIAVFQPHTHNRTKELLNEFIGSFEDCDIAVILDIYAPAGREESSSVHATDISTGIAALGRNALYVSSFEEASCYLTENCRENDLLITLGAGDVYLLGDMLVSSCQ